MLLGAAVAVGVAVGLAWPDADDQFSAAVWVPLGAVLYLTFAQVDLASLPRALTDRRFLGASLIGNFVLIPLLVAVLVAPLRGDPAIQLGAAMVLLAPCTDWFATFTHLGRGDAKRATAVIPILLIAQLALLPFYLPLVARDVSLQGIDTGPFVIAFLAVIVLPLMLALVTRVLLPRRHEERWERLAERGTPLLLAVTLFLVAAAHAPAVRDSGTELGTAAVIFAAYALLALWLARMVARVVSLDQPARRTLAFNFGTRNSFVILPLALALPADLSAAVAVIALQSLIELGAMIVYLHAVPSIVFPDRGFDEE